MKKPAAILIGLLLIVIFLIVTVILVVALISIGGGRAVLGNNIAIIDIEGEIDSVGDYLNLIKKYEDSDYVQAIILRIESPGGYVGSSQEVYSQIRNLKRSGKKPVFASIANVGASGAYYIALGADEIWANPGSITGSIGVILSHLNIGPLSEKVGIEAEYIKSGKRKGTGQPFRKLTDDEKAYLQDIISDTHQQFLEAVIENRSEAFKKVLEENDSDAVSPETIENYAKKLADGSIYTGRQAAENGLIDNTGTLSELIKYIANKVGIEGEPRVIRYKESESFLDKLTGTAKTIIHPQTASRFSLQYRMQLP